MADEHVHADGQQAPPAGEVVHLPGPSYLPVLTALGITVGLVGVLISWIMVAIGLVITLICVWLWIRETRRDIAELPREHR